MTRRNFGPHCTWTVVAVLVWAHTDASRVVRSTKSNDPLLGHNSGAHRKKTGTGKSSVASPAAAQILCVAVGAAVSSSSFCSSCTADGRLVVVAVVLGDRIAFHFVPDCDCNY